MNTEADKQAKKEKRDAWDKTYRDNKKKSVYVLRVNFDTSEEKDEQREAWLKKQGVMTDTIKALIDAAMTAEGAN